MAEFNARNLKNLGIPNLLSILRLVLIPVFVVAFFSFSANAGLFAAAILVVSGLTDIADGVIARRYQQVTTLGRILDPLADKLTQATVCICLVIQWIGKGQFGPVALLGLIIFKEIVMIGAGANIIRKKKELVSAKWFGKLSTVVFYLVMILIIAFQPGTTAVEILIAVSILFMLFSFAMYIPIFLEIASGRERHGK